MDNETKKTEQLIQIYKENRAEENFYALMQQMQKTVFFVPAILPDTPEMREIRQKMREHPGEKINLPEQIRPIPAVLSNQNGERYFPIYTAPGQVPKEPKPEILMQMPFLACCHMALDPRIGANGLVANPFTDSIRLEKELILAMQKGELGRTKEERLSPQQQMIRMRQKAEFHDFPLRAFREGKEFILRLSDEKEAVVNEIYRGAFSQIKPYPFHEEDFAVMALNISEDLLLARVDLPPVTETAQLCWRVYLTLGMQSDEIRYFTIEQGRGRDERLLGGMDAQGRHLEYGAAPPEGAELQKILSILRQEEA